MKSSVYYSRDVIMDTLQLIKKVIYAFDVVFQLIYLAYLSFKIANGGSLLIANIVLIVLSFSYLVYYLVTTKEFYTLEQKQNRKNVRSLTRICKRITDFIIIILAIIQLYNLPANNIEVLTTLILIGSFVLAILFDVVKSIIDNRVAMIKNAISLDRYTFVENLPKVVKWINESKKIISTDKPNIHPRMMRKLKASKHRCEFKARRKRDFENMN